MATNIVDKIRNEAILVCNPNSKKRPPTASLKAPIQAKKAGAMAKMPPYAATSFGNQKATSNSPRLLSTGDHGNPNFAAPKSEVNKYPQTILGMARKKSCHQKGNTIGCVILLSTFMISQF